jgi:hypothetical protein
MTGSPGGPGSQPQEPVFLNLFECYFVLPTIVATRYGPEAGSGLILQQAKSITFDVTPALTSVEQKFKYSGRAFISPPQKTTVDLTMDFNVNVNNTGSIENWNIMKSWYDLCWNSQNGYLHYKQDTVGTIIVNNHDKKGVVLRRITFQNAQIKSIGSPQFTWEQEGIWSFQCTFVADYWIDEYIDNQFTIVPPLVSVY